VFSELGTHWAPGIVHCGSTCPPHPTPPPPPHRPPPPPSSSSTPTAPHPEPLQLPAPVSQLHTSKLLRGVVVVHANGAVSVVGDGAASDAVVCAIPAPAGPLATRWSTLTPRADGRSAVLTVVAQRPTTGDCFVLFHTLAFGGHTASVVASCEASATVALPAPAVLGGVPDAAGAGAGAGAGATSSAAAPGKRRKAGALAAPAVAAASGAGAGASPAGWVVSSVVLHCGEREEGRGAGGMLSLCWLPPAANGTCVWQAYTLGSPAQSWVGGAAALATARILRYAAEGAGALGAGGPVPVPCLCAAAQDVVLAALPVSRSSVALTAWSVSRGVLLSTARVPGLVKAAPGAGGTAPSAGPAKRVRAGEAATPGAATAAAAVAAAAANGGSKGSAAPTPTARPCVVAAASDDGCWVGVVVVGTGPGPSAVARVLPMPSTDTDLLACLGRARASRKWLGGSGSGSGSVGAGASAGAGAGAGAGTEAAPARKGTAVGLTPAEAGKEPGFDWARAIGAQLASDAAALGRLRAAHAGGVPAFVAAVRAEVREVAPCPGAVRWAVTRCLRALGGMALGEDGTLGPDGNLVVAALKGLVTKDRVSSAAHPSLVPLALRLHQLVRREPPTPRAVEWGGVGGWGWGGVGFGVGVGVELCVSV
jgi:hypothetical protein